MDNTDAMIVYQLKYNIGSRAECFVSDLYLNKELFVEHVNTIIGQRKEYEATYQLEWDQECEFMLDNYTIEDLENNKFLVYKCKAVGIKCEVLTHTVIN